VKLVVACLLCACREEQNLGLTKNDTAGPDGSGEPAVVGSARWAIDLGTAYADSGNGVAIDSTGDVIAIGVFGGPPDSLGIPIPTGFITKRAASDGSERWTVDLVATADRSYLDVQGVAVDSVDDSIAVVGQYENSIDFGGQTLVSSNIEESDSFVAKYSASGELEWVTTPATTADSLAVTIDSAEQITVTGSITTDAGSDAGPNTFVTAYDASGSQRWTHTLVNTQVSAIAVAANNDVVLAGSLSVPTSVGGAVLTPATSTSTYLTRFSNNGSYVTSSIVGSHVEWPTGVAVDEAGDVVVQTFDNDNPASSRPSNVYAIDDNGDELWSAQLADDSNYSPLYRTLAIAPGDYVVSSAWDEAPDGSSGNMQVVALDATGSSSTSTFGAISVSAPAETSANASAISPSGAAAYIGNFVGTIQLAGTELAAQNQTPIDDPSDVFIVLLAPPMN
jgi:hypothetical protein